MSMHYESLLNINKGDLSGLTFKIVDIIENKTHDSDIENRDHIILEDVDSTKYRLDVFSFVNFFKIGGKDVLGLLEVEDGKVDLPSEIKIVTCEDEEKINVATGSPFKTYHIEMKLD